MTVMTYIWVGWADMMCGTDRIDGADWTVSLTGMTGRTGLDGLD